METVSLVESYGVSVLLKNPQVIDVVLFLGEFDQVCTYALALEEMLDVKLDDLLVLYTNKTFDDTIIFTDPDVIKNLRSGVFLSYREHLNLTERNRIISEDAAVVHPLNEDQDLSDSGYIFDRGFSNQLRNSRGRRFSRCSRRRRYR